tara:strand:+ start:8902 stop:9345 length:444 start_codon:yes stop_codon:yes gene_type:complete
MKISKNIKLEMYRSMKSGEKNKAIALRTLLAKLKYKKIEKGVDLSEKEELDLMKSIAKQRKESIVIFEKANREDLVEKEKAELKIIESYLPEMLSVDDTKKIVKSVIRETGAKEIKDLRMVMPQIIKKTNGEIDGKIANQIAKELLQ